VDVKKIIAKDRYNFERMMKEMHFLIYLISLKAYEYKQSKMGVNKKKKR
jgi:hypothetical protein